MMLILFALLPPIVGYFLTDGTKQDYMMLYAMTAVIVSICALVEITVAGEDRWWWFGGAVLMWFAVYVLSR